jgi:phage/plasmid-associated DNA primase
MQALTMTDEPFDYSKLELPAEPDAKAANGSAPAVRVELQDYPATDYGNAERLVDLHGHDIRYVPGRGWHHWDGQRWQRDETGEATAA